ncbi:MAG TPA: ATP-binding protein, partial [Ktedonobacterales bacterium]
AGLSAAGPSAAGLSAAGPSAARRRPRRETHGMLSLGEAAGEYTTALRAAFPTPMRPHAAGGPGMRGLGAETCPVCHGAGFVRDDVPLGDPSFGQAVPCVCKERALEERRRADLRRMSSLDAFHDKTFATFDASIPGLREAYEVARRYAEDPQGWLVLSGGYGAGKTHLAAAIASERLAAGQSVFFSITPDLLDHLRATFAPTSETPYDELFDKVREAGLLALDDLGAENGTAWATEKLFQIINYRYNYHMPTVITTNHRLLSHMDERIRSRLADISFVRHIAIDVPDYRERHTGARRRGSGASGGQAPRGPAATSHGRGGYTPR